jgi:hypothetical protein
LPTLKGRSKIKEGECLLSLGKTKKSFNQGKTQQMSKVDTIIIIKKKNGAINMTFGIQDKAPDAIR